MKAWAVNEKAVLRNFACNYLRNALWNSGGGQEGQLLAIIADDKHSIDILEVKINADASLAIGPDPITTVRQTIGHVPIRDICWAPCHVCWQTLAVG